MSHYTIEVTTKFKRSVKKCKKRGCNMELLKEVINHLSINGEAPAKCKPHKLSGRFARMWECHIEPDWLLIWDQNDTELIMLLVDTGSHSDLF